MNSIITLFFSLATVSSSVLGADESYHGMGSMMCYGDMSVTLGGNEGEGFLDCQPAWGSPAAPPQGIIADGSDGSHWVTVDDKGYGDCDGTIWYEYGDLGLGYCNRLTVTELFGTSTETWGLATA